ncbi:hypothetical protein HanRHA438_Chr08g0342691 [Helianthus annuus]|nr:hypothetical protein HanHA89_Chr08g0290931 [Helianthus annuus]KAJ0897168.1 hypothetical protein HanRHA438_Chr08g0342691 [Helianthus annuus]
MTIPQFAVATGFYTKEEVQAPGFATSQRDVVKKRRQHSVMKDDLVRFWSTIATVPYSNNMVASDITDPIYQFIHKILAATLVSKH